MVFAVIPAAGKSSRMGRPKLLLPIGGQTTIECIINTFQTAQVSRIIVVVPPESDQLRTVAERAGATVLMLPSATPDMRTTIEYGLTWAEQNWLPRDDDAWFLAPADHPVILSSVVENLAREFQAGRNDDEYDVVVPTFENQRGHPTLIKWSMVSRVRELPPGVGLNALFRDPSVKLKLLPVEDRGIVFDMNTPAEYDRLTTWAANELDKS